MKLLITGGTGFVGRELAAALAPDHELYFLMRREPRAGERIPGQCVREVAKIDQPLDAVINLAGENLAAGRWTAKRKRALRDSRIRLTKSLAEQLKSAGQQPELWLNASAVGYYGDRPGEILTEESAAGDDFAAMLCRDWEVAAQSAAGILGVKRLCIFRLGVVLGPGGALQKMRLPFSLGLGAVLGGGDQHMPWIALPDVREAFVAALSDSRYSEVINLVSPDPRSQREFSRALGETLGRPLMFRAPAWSLSLGMGEMSSVLLADQHCSPERLKSLGFPFLAPTLESALSQALGIDEAGEGIQEG